MEIIKKKSKNFKFSSLNFFLYDCADYKQTFLPDMGCLKGFHWDPLLAAKQERTGHRSEQFTDKKRVTNIGKHTV